jgi:hypothetical protein
MDVIVELLKDRIDVEKEPVKRQRVQGYSISKNRRINRVYSPRLILM